jgi:predicted translin family RNA/ssDNA-binding protein
MTEKTTPGRMRNLRKNDVQFDRLPARVVVAIRAKQDASERLIGWFQLAVVVIFGLLYAASRISRIPISRTR